MPDLAESSLLMSGDDESTARGAGGWWVHSGRMLAPRLLGQVMTVALESTPAATRPRLWTPRHVQVTAAAAEQPHTAEILRRLEDAGVEDVRMLPSNRLAGLGEGSEREIYARAKRTLAVVVAPPSALKPQPIPPSADWRIDLAKGCPAH